MKYHTKIKILQILNLLLSVVGIYYLLVFDYSYIYICMLTFLIFGIIGANIGLHRYFSHKSFQTHKFVENILAILGTLTTLGSIIHWTAVHRFHHMKADTIEDPHSPIYIGLYKAYTFQWKEPKVSKKIIRDLLSNKTVLFVHKNYFKIIFVYLLILLLIDPLFILFMYSIPATLCLNGVAAVTVICHIHGYKTYDTKDYARNSWIASILSLGEGWHNNHHAKPYLWKQGMKWWEFDPSAIIIKGIKL